MHQVRYVHVCQLSHGDRCTLQSRRVSIQIMYRSGIHAFAYGRMLYAYGLNRDISAQAYLIPRRAIHRNIGSRTDTDAAHPPGHANDRASHPIRDRTHMDA